MTKLKNSNCDESKNSDSDTSTTNEIFSGQCFSYTLVALFLAKFLTKVIQHLLKIPFLFFNRPSLAGVIFLRPLSLIHYFNKWLIQTLWKYLQKLCFRAKVQKFWENVHPQPCVTCHVSCVKMKRDTQKVQVSEVNYIVMVKSVQNCQWVQLQSASCGRWSFVCLRARSVL